MRFVVIDKQMVTVILVVHAQLLDGYVRRVSAAKDGKLCGTALNIVVLFHRHLYLVAFKNGSSPGRVQANRSSLGRRKGYAARVGLGREV